MIRLPTAFRRFSPGNGDKMRVRAVARAVGTCLVLVALSGCSEDASSPLQPPTEAPPAAADAHDGEDDRDRGDVVARVVGSLIRAPHSWPIVNWSTIRGLDVTLDEDGNPDGSFDLDIEVDFGAGPFLQQTTEEVICLEIAERDDGTTDIWISSAAQGWVTVPPGVTHFAITHIADSPDGDLLAGRSILPVDGEPSEFCKTRPDLSASDPTGLGPVVLMAAEAGNVVSLRE